MSRTRGALGAVALLLLLSAIGTAVGLLVSSGDGDLPPPRSRPAAAPEGSLRVGVPELPATYDPFDIRSRAPAATQVLALVLPQLFEVTPGGDVRGRLVEDGSVVEEGRTVRFRLAPGATWSDGAPITVADLTFTLDVVRSAAWPGPDAGYDLVESITGEGRVVTVRFSRRFPGWERLFSGDDYVLPRHRLEGRDLATEWATGPDLSGGPYVLRGSTPGLDVVLSANPAWWGDGPGVRDLQVLTVPDATTLQYLFEQGDLDVVWMPAFTERVREMEGIEDVDVEVAAPGGRLVSLYLQTDEVGDALRVAVLDLVDRNRFVQVLLEGEADVATSWGLLERDTGWPRWFVDPSKADGMEKRDLAFAVPDEDPMAGLLARATQRRARSTPLTLDAVRLANHLLDGEWLPRGMFDVAFADEVQWPEPCWRCRFGSPFIGETNWARVEAYDDLAARADAGDAAAASALEHRLQGDGVVLPLWRPAAVVAARGVDGIEANAWSPGPFWHVERWQTSTERPVQSSTSSTVPSGG